MILFLLAVAILIVIPAALTFVLNHFWPEIPAVPLAFAAGLIVSAAIGLFFIVAFRKASQHVPGPEEIDSGGMVLASLMVLGPIAVLCSVAFTVPAAMLTMRYLRNRAAR